MIFLKLCRNQWDRAIALLAVIGGIAAVVIGWIGSQGTIFTFEQVPYLISGGLLGTCLVVVGAALWISADLRDEWRKLDSIDESLKAPRSAGTDASGQVDVRDARWEPTSDARLRVSK